MRFEEPPIEGRFLRRYKRFFADVELDDGSVVTAHCPNTGQLIGCKEERSRVWLRDSHNPARKLRYTWQAIEVGGVWVNVDTSLPNRVVSEAVEQQSIPALSGYPELRREVPYGDNSRIDLLLSGSGEACYVEVKNTTYALGSTSLFPDAVTERGRKHLRELRQVASNGRRAVQFFFVSRDDVDVFRPADAIDPEYGRELREALDEGVEVLAWRARVEPLRLALDRPLELDFSHEPARMGRKLRKKA